MEELKLSITEAQDYLLLSQSSVYSWIDKGKLQSKDTPSGKIIVISSKEAEQIRNFNLKSKRNKVARQSTDKFLHDDDLQENPIINGEIYDSTSNDIPHKTSGDITLHLMNKIEELAVEAGRFKQLEILRKEEIKDLKFWQEKYYEIKSELTAKEFEISALNKQIQELKESKKSGKSLFNLFSKN